MTNVPVSNILRNFELVHQMFHNLYVAFCACLVQSSATIVVTQSQVSARKNIAVKGKEINIINKLYISSVSTKFSKTVTTK